MAQFTSTSTSRILAALLVLVMSAFPHLSQASINPQVPISVPAAGFFVGVGSPAANITVETFLDLNCPDSAAAWTVVQQLASIYQPEEVAVKVLWSPLPFHRNSMICTQGYYAVRALKPGLTVSYISTVYGHVAEWSSAATANMTEPEVLKKLAMYTSTKTGIPANIFLDVLPKYRDAVIADWKLAAKRSVAGTPWYFVNGIDVGNDSNTLAMWKRFLDELLKGKKTKSSRRTV